MKKSLKKVSIFLAIMAFAMLFKCSEAKIVGEKTDKVTAGLYTNLIEGKEVILVSPNASYKLTSDNESDKHLYKSDLNKFFSENNITVKSIKDSDGNAKNMEQDAITTGDIISDGKIDRTLILCGDPNKDNELCKSADWFIIIYDYIEKQKATDIQKIAANLYNEDDTLTVFDINRMVKKFLGYDGSTQGNKNMLEDTLIFKMPSDGSSGEDPVNPPAGEYGIQVKTEGGAQITIGGTTKVKATITPNSADQSVEFSSANNSIATVDQNGIVTGVAVGETAITATSKTYKNSETGKYLSGTVNIKVTENIVHVSKLEISIDNKNLNVNGTAQITTKVTPDNATYKNVVFESSDTSVATVDSTGKVTAKKVGTADITATIKEETNMTPAKITITVQEVKVSKLSISGATSVMVGENTTLIATIEPTNAANKTLKWTSSDPSKATVSENGVVTGISGGDVIITCETTDGSNLSCEQSIYVYDTITT